MVTLRLHNIWNIIWVSLCIIHLNIPRILRLLRIHYEILLLLIYRLNILKIVLIEICLDILNIYFHHLTRDRVVLSLKIRVLLVKICLIIIIIHFHHLTRDLVVLNLRIRVLLVVYILIISIFNFHHLTRGLVVLSLRNSVLLVVYILISNVIIDGLSSWVLLNELLIK